MVPMGRPLGVCCPVPLVPRATAPSVCGSLPSATCSYRKRMCRWSASDLDTVLGPPAGAKRLQMLCEVSARALEAAPSRREAVSTVGLEEEAGDRG